MAMTPHKKAFLQIHFCVLLWGFTAILGKTITLPALPLVWWRMLIVTAALVLLPRVWRGVRAMPRKLFWSYAGVGALVALHWLTFYGAIKLSNASIGATCIALATVFTALVEPMLAHRRFSRGEIALGLAVLPGVALVVGGIEPEMRIGVVVGALSALLVALFGSLNKRLVGHADPEHLDPKHPDSRQADLKHDDPAHAVQHLDPLTVTALELGAGTLVLTLLAPVMPFVFPAFAGELFALPSAHDTAYLLVLALVCTLLPFALSLLALRHMSAFAAQLAVNLEPVYAIVLGIVLLGEQHDVTPSFYAGVVVILVAVLVHPLISRPRRLEQPEALAIAEAKQIAE